MAYVIKALCVLFDVGAEFLNIYSFFALFVVELADSPRLLQAFIIVSPLRGSDINKIKCTCYINR